MSDDIPASLAEAMAEIRRLRAEASRLHAVQGEARLNTYEPPEYVALPKAELQRLYARIAELEGAAAVTFGTLEQPTPDEPATYTHNLPPSAPPHNE